MSSDRFDHRCNCRRPSPQPMEPRKRLASSPRPLTRRRQYEHPRAVRRNEFLACPAAVSATHRQRWARNDFALSSYSLPLARTLEWFERQALLPHRIRRRRQSPGDSPCAKPRSGCRRRARDAVRPAQRIPYASQGPRRADKLPRVPAIRLSLARNERPSLTASRNVKTTRRAAVRQPGGSALDLAHTTTTGQGTQGVQLAHLSRC